MFVSFFIKKNVSLRAKRSGDGGIERTLLRNDEAKVQTGRNSNWSFMPLNSAHFSEHVTVFYFKIRQKFIMYMRKLNMSVNNFSINFEAHIFTGKF